MTKEELRKIFDETEKKVFSPENAAKILLELKDSEKLKAVDERDLACRIHRVLDRELIFEVLSRVVADK